MRERFYAIAHSIGEANIYLRKREKQNAHNLTKLSICIIIHSRWESATIKIRLSTRIIRASARPLPYPHFFLPGQKQTLLPSSDDDDAEIRNEEKDEVYESRRKRLHYSCLKRDEERSTEYKPNFLLVEFALLCVEEVVC